MASKSGPVRPTEPNQMPWIVITCGTKDKDPHGRIVIAEFFDSRFTGAGHAWPRTDMPLVDAEKFSWDYYRLDMGKPILLAPKKPGDDPIATREHKSALKNWDKPDGFYIQCPMKVPKEGRFGISKVQCKKRTLVRREDWNEFLTTHFKNNQITEGAATVFLSWKELMLKISEIQSQRNATK